MTALGYSAPMTAASVRASLSRFRESPMIDKVGEPMLLSMTRFLNPEIQDLDRLLALGTHAAKEGLEPLVKVTERSGRFSPEIGLCLGLPSSRPGLKPDLAGPLCSQLIAQLLPWRLAAETVFETGHASGLMAIEHAVDLIRAGTEFVLAGGVDSYYSAETLEWLDQTGRLHSEANMDGFIPGEGAGFCLLTSSATALRYGLSPLAEVLSAESGEEPHPLISDGVCLGQGMTGVFSKVLSVPVPAPKVADWTLCDMNGESFRSTEWMYAYLRTGRKHRDPLQLWHPADCYGDIGAASGPVLAGIAMAAWRRSYARGDRCLVWTASEGKHRSAALLQRASVS